MSRTKSYRKRIDELIVRYRRSLVGKESLVQIIEESEVAENVYNSNAIENSTLSLEETEKILMQIDLDRYISERELFEAKNLARVMAYVRKVVCEKPISKEVILLLHKMLIANICDEIAGRFRQSGEYVRVGYYIAPPPEEVINRIDQMLLDFAGSPEHIVRRVARMHLDFECTHPFVDGNGRIGRVIVNYALIREGYVPVNIRFASREEYYAAFRAYNTNQNTELMEDIVGKALTNSLHKRIAYFEGRKIIDLEEYARREGTSHSNVLNKAVRQTISAFREKGQWKIGL